MCQIIFQSLLGLNRAISQIMFNLYRDNVLIIFKQSGIGCHINGTYNGCSMVRR